MTDLEIIEEIKKFIDNENNNAITIDGEWGIGKTYLLKEKLRTIINENSDYSYIYITPEDLLNSSIREICYYDYIQKIKDKKSRFFWFQKIFNKNSKHLREISKVDKVSGSVFSFFNAINNGLVKNQIKKHNLDYTFIIIDEIERKPDSLYLKDILNQIFSIKEEFKKVKIITSLNKEGLKTESKEEYDIFNNWLDKISNKDYFFNRSNHFDSELENLNIEISNLLDFNIDLINIFENINSDKNKYNLREFKKFSEEIIDIVKLIKNFKIKDFNYNEENIFSFLNIFTEYYYSSCKEIKDTYSEKNKNYLEFIKLFYKSNNKKEILKEKLIKLNFYIDIDLQKNKEYFSKKRIFDNGYGTFFKNWELEEEHPFEYYKNLMINNPEYFSFSQYTDTAFSKIEHLCNLFNKSDKEIEEITVDFLNIKHNQLLKSFIKIETYEEVHYRVMYYDYLISELESIIENLNSPKLSFLKKLNKKYIKSILKKYKSLLKNKESYKYVIKYVFKNNYNILVYLEKDRDYSQYYRILKKLTNDIKFLFYLINMIEELRKKEVTPSKYNLQYYQNFGDFNIYMLRMLKKNFNSKYYKNIDNYINKNNKFNINLDYFCKTLSII